MTAVRFTRRPPAQDVEPSGMWAHDLRREAVAGLFARPVRMALTVLGTVIGVAALVATLGLSRTASHQIIARFDELAATEITVSSTPAPRARRPTTSPGTRRPGSPASTAWWPPGP